MSRIDQTENIESISESFIMVALQYRNLWVICKNEREDTCFFAQGQKKVNESDEHAAASILFENTGITWNKFQAIPTTQSSLHTIDNKLFFAKVFDDTVFEQVNMERFLLLSREMVFQQFPTCQEIIKMIDEHGCEQKERTPLFSAVQNYCDKQFTRFHMPGHKGVLPFPFDTIAPYDITEVTGADSLYTSSGAIAHLEHELADIYHARASLLSAGGSTLCIQSMLSLAVRPKGKILISRGCHTSAVNSMVLLDITPIWIWSERNRATGLADPVTGKQVGEMLQRFPDVSAVYLTSPDYYGQNSELEEIVKICHEHQKPLLLDAAHGAHYPFISNSLNPMDLGVDLCCHSLHKTLPALTGAAVLNISNPNYIPQAKQRMALFGSTSPSYPIMLSADGLISWLKFEAPQQLHELKLSCERITQKAKEKGFVLPSHDMIRITLGFFALGLSKEEFWEKLRLYEIEPEYIDDKYVVLLPSSFNSSRDWDRLDCLLNSMAPSPLKSQDDDENDSFPQPIAEISLQQAYFACSREVPIEKSVGRIVSGNVTICPPGIPIVVPGEKIDLETMLFLKKSGILLLNVLE